MGKLTKKQKLAAEKIEAGKAYSLKEAASLVKEITFSKFDASLDIDVRLGVDPRKANQMVRGVVSLPHGTGKEVRVLVLCTPDQETAAKEAGADYVGDVDLLQKIEKENWFDFDTMIATPDMMPLLGKLGRVLGPKGLMPNPKTGTVTMDPAKAVADAKAGRVEYRTDSFGNVHAVIGKVSFSEEDLKENLNAFVSTIMKIRPASVKGDYVKNIAITSTMGPGVKVSTAKYVG